MFNKHYNPPSFLYETRFCGQDDFDIIVSGTLCKNDPFVSKKLAKLHYPSLKEVNNILICGNSSYNSVVKGSDVYTFCRKVDSRVFEYVGKYSEKHKYSRTIILPENIIIQLACSFMIYLFVLTLFAHKPNISCCLKYNIKQYSGPT